MAQMLELTFADGNRIHIEGSEATEATRITERGGLDDAVQKATAPFESAISTLRGIANGLNVSLNTADHPPDAVTLRFGMNFSIEYGVVLTKGSAGANLEVVMEWKKKES